MLIVCYERQRGSASSFASAPPLSTLVLVMTAAFDDEDFMGHKWSVRLRCLSVAGNIGTHADGTRYTYLALQLGPLYYYPAMLGRAFLLGWHDVYDELEALRTVRHHHISLCYLPEVSALQLEIILRAFNRRLEEWKELRFKAQDRLEQFVTYRRTCLLDVPYQVGQTGMNPSGRWITLRRWTPAEIADAYWARRFGDTWHTVAGQLVQRDPNGLRDLLSLSANNQRRYAEAVNVVQYTLSLPIYNEGYASTQEWPEWLPCFLDGTSSYRLQVPSELADLAYFVIQAWRTQPCLRQHHRIFAGDRDDHFKVQSLDELHVTPIREMDGSIAVRFTCPRLEVALAQI